MHFFTFLILAFVFYSCQHSSSGYKAMVNLSEQSRPIDSFLKEGVFNVLFYASKETSKEDIALLHKAAQLIKTNEHTSRFFDQLSKGETPVFTTRMGMTKKEFEKLKDIFACEKPKETKGILQILKKGDVIGFKGDRALQILDSVTISPFFDRVYFRSYALAYDSADIDLSNAKIPVVLLYLQRHIPRLVAMNFGINYMVEQRVQVRRTVFKKQMGDTLRDFRLFEGPVGVSGLMGLNELTFFCFK